ncbi:MAG: glycosyltransferase family 4 protein [Gemmatimonadetes bacterium]|nr:glycosyltransferase family 4 protein [Gemmatimonadota bacterium]
MRILYLNHNVAWTGTFFRAFHLAREIVELGHDVTLVTTSRRRRVTGEILDCDGVEIVEAPDLLWGPARTGWDPWNTLHRWFALRPREFDLIHAFDCRPAVILPALAVRNRTGARLFIDWADWWGRGGRIQQRSGWPVRTFFGPLETWFEEAFRGRADGTTVICRALEERWRKLTSGSAPVHRFPNGCNLREVAPIPREEARQELGIDPDRPLLAHIGEISRADLRLLTEALREVRRRSPETQAVLIGTVRVPVPADLRDAGAIVLTGRVPVRRLSLWLAATDLCVVPMADTPGNRGRWPGKVNDYFSAGRPTVMTRVGDAAELVEEERVGWTSDPEAHALAEAMLQALASRDELLSRGVRARELAETSLSWREMARGLEKFYTSVSSGRWSAD